MTRARIRHPLTGLATALALLACGCGGPPPATPVEGIVLLDGQPLPQARVQFFPDLPGREAMLVSSAVTDEKGRFTLRLDAREDSGAVVGKHRVVVSEPPPRPEFRSPSQKAQEGYARYQATLKNRPIPDAYGSVARTRLLIEVTAEQKEYTLKLTRGQK